MDVGICVCNKSVRTTICVYNIIYNILPTYLCILLLSPCIMGNIIFNQLGCNLFEALKRRATDVNTVDLCPSIISYNYIMGHTLGLIHGEEFSLIFGLFHCVIQLVRAILDDL